jgi:uncharacterized protein YhfF
MNSGDFWRAYLEALPDQHPHRAQAPDAFPFGGGGALGNELARLVLAGKKRATTSLPVEFTAVGDPLPLPGSVSIILDSSSNPLAIIERTQVDAVPFEEVGAAYAAIEGEGDGSLVYWRRIHREYFEDVCSRLGGVFDERTIVLCQVFRVVWPRDAL